jgi:hypothetical protein
VGKRKFQAGDKVLFCQNREQIRGTILDYVPNARYKVQQTDWPFEVYELSTSSIWPYKERSQEDVIRDIFQRVKWAFPRYRLAHDSVDDSGGYGTLIVDNDQTYLVELYLTPKTTE